MVAAAASAARAERAVTGLVVDDSTGLPIAGAFVSVGAGEAASGDDGRFTIAEVPFGRHDVVVIADGYRAYFGSARVGAALTIRLEPETGGGEVIRITGRAPTGRRSTSTRRRSVTCPAPATMHCARCRASPVAIDGPILSERLPAFFQLDLRVDHAWRRPWGVLNLYIDVQNVTNRRNAEGVTYNEDYTQRSFTRGLPIFPSIGVEYIPLAAEEERPLDEHGPIERRAALDHAGRRATHPSARDHHVFARRDREPHAELPAVAAREQRVVHLDAEADVGFALAIGLGRARTRVEVPLAVAHAGADLRVERERTRAREQRDARARVVAVEVGANVDAEPVHAARAGVGLHERQERVVRFEEHGAEARTDADERTKLVLPGRALIGERERKAEPYGGSRRRGRRGEGKDAGDSEGVTHRGPHS